MKEGEKREKTKETQREETKTEGREKARGM